MAYDQLFAQGLSSAAECFRIAHQRGVVRAGGGGEAESHEIEDRQRRKKAMQALHPGVPFQPTSLGRSEGGYQPPAALQMDRDRPGTMAGASTRVSGLGVRARAG